MRTIPLLLLAGAAEPAARLAAAAGSCVGACRRAAHGAPEEDAFLLQHRSQDLTDATDVLPDLGRLADKVQSAVGGATAKANKVVATILTTAGGTVNGTVAKLRSSVDEYAAVVKQSASSARVGVTALLADAFAISVPGLHASEKDKEYALSLVGQADDIVQATVLSVKASSAALDAIPDTVFKMTKMVNTSIEEALTRCDDFAKTIGDLRRILDDAARNFTQPEAAFLQATSAAESAKYQQKSAFSDAAEAVLSHGSLLQAAAGETPSSAMSRLKGALTAARDELSEFSTSFKGAFVSMSDGVKEGISGDSLGVETTAPVVAMFEGISGVAGNIADDLSQALDQLFGIIDDGAAAPGLPNAGRGLAPAHSLVAFALVLVGLASVLSAMGVV